MFGGALNHVERHRFKINLPANTNQLVHHSGRKGVKIMRELQTPPLLKSTCHQQVIMKKHHIRLNCLDYLTEAERG